MYLLTHISLFIVIFSFPTINFPQWGQKLSFMCIPYPSFNKFPHPSAAIYFEYDFTYCFSMNVVGKNIGELSPLRLHLIFLPDELTASQKDSLSFEFNRLFV